MKNTNATLNLLVLIALLSGCAKDPEPALTWHASGNGGVVAAGTSSVSAQTGIDILGKGGNAVDGAVAVIFNLAVSEYGSFNFGGEVPFMFYSTKTGKVKVFNGMGSAPKDAEAIDWYYKNGIPKDGIKASTVPSALSTCLAALEQEGTMSFEEVIAPTLVLLDAGGKSWYPNLAGTIRKLIDTERNTTGSREQKIRAARDRFYKGDIADELNDYYVQSGGLLRKTDLESHVTLVEEPVSVRYRGYDVYKCNTWTQGPVLLQSLKLVENYDLRSMKFFSTDYIHVVTEAMKLAFADRDKYYGDPAFVSVPLDQMLSDRYARIRFPLIDLHSASHAIRPGDPYRMTATSGPGQYWPGEHGTTTCVVADKWGNVVAATPSANPEYGVCERLGVAHNTRLSSLNTQTGHPNSLEPGKRPRITLTPTIVLKDGKPVLAISVSGGDVQDQVALQLVLDFVEFEMVPKDAISAPRFIISHFESSFEPSPDPASRVLSLGTLNIDSTGRSTVEELTGYGHQVSSTEKNYKRGYPAMIYLDHEAGIAYAAGEPSVRYCAALDISD
ncbi:MAG: gamma-glutamyltransferase [Cyclobacteriaceae bacterium]